MISRFTIHCPTNATRSCKTDTIFYHNLRLLRRPTIDWLRLSVSPWVAAAFNCVSNVVSTQSLSPLAGDSRTTIAHRRQAGSAIKLELGYVYAEMVRRTGGQTTPRLAEWLNDWKLNGGLFIVDTPSCGWPLLCRHKNMAQLVCNVFHRPMHTMTWLNTTRCNCPRNDG